MIFAQEQPPGRDPAPILVVNANHPFPAGCPDKNKDAVVEEQDGHRWIDKSMLMGRTRRNSITP
jgi:hypothetical protein